MQLSPQALSLASKQELPGSSFCTTVLSFPEQEEDFGSRRDFWCDRRFPAHRTERIGAVSKLCRAHQAGTKYGEGIRMGCQNTKQGQNMGRESEWAVVPDLIRELRQPENVPLHSMKHNLFSNYARLSPAIHAAQEPISMPDCCSKVAILSA